jgi:hypothetical protein
MDERPDVDDRSTEEIERDIAAARESIKETVDEIEERLHRAVDWRQLREGVPWIALALAVGAGVLVGRSLTRPRCASAAVPLPSGAGDLSSRGRSGAPRRIERDARDHRVSELSATGLKLGLVGFDDEPPKLMLVASRRSTRKTRLTTIDSPAPTPFPDRTAADLAHSRPPRDWAGRCRVREHRDRLASLGWSAVPACADPAT